MDINVPTRGRAVSDIQYTYNPYSYTYTTSTPVIGDINSPTQSLAPYLSTLHKTPSNYREELQQCKFFYRYSPTASTVINRMSELAAGELKLRRGGCDDEEFFYYQAILPEINKVLRSITLQYLIAGMAIPEYSTRREMGNRLHPKLGKTRKRYAIPENMWVRNPENIILKREPFGGGRRVYLEVPNEEINFIRNKGKYSDDTEDRELYELLVRNFPEYVRAILDGKTKFLLKNSKPVLRKESPDADFPQPFLVPALAALKHKLRIQEMDHMIATRAIEAILHIKAGSDEYPADEAQLNRLKEQMKARSVDTGNQLVYKFFTDHTVELGWIYPPLEALLSTDKYDAVDADIFMAMGFSRVLLVGENNKSNAGSGVTSILGPMAMLNDMRASMLEWLAKIFEEYRVLNGFQHAALPYFPRLTLSPDDVLLQAAAAAFKSQVISRNSYAQLFGSDFETEVEQRAYELETIDTLIPHESPPPTTPEPTVAPKAAPGG